MHFTNPGAAARADPAIVAGGLGGLTEKEQGSDCSEAGHLHSKVALEAALGACREKTLELELRLRSAEQRIQIQVHAMRPLCWTRTWAVVALISFSHLQKQSHLSFVGDAGSTRYSLSTS